MNQRVSAVQGGETDTEDTKTTPIREQQERRKALYNNVCTLIK